MPNWFDQKIDSPRPRKFFDLQKRVGLPSHEASSLLDLAQLANLPDLSVVEPGSGWDRHRLALLNANHDAAIVIEKLINAMPEAETTDPGILSAAVDGFTKAIASSAWAAVAAITGLTSLAVSLTGDAVVKAPAEAIGQSLVACWIAANKSIDIYRADEATARALFERAKVSEPEVTEDYKKRLGMLQAIVLVDASGALDAILATHTSGRARMGGWAVVTIAVAAAVVAVAWAVSEWIRLEALDRAFFASCIDPATGKIRPEVETNPNLAKLCADLGAAYKPSGIDLGGLGAAAGGFGVGLAVAAGAGVLLLLLAAKKG